MHVGGNAIAKTINQSANSTCSSSNEKSGKTPLLQMYMQVHVNVRINMVTILLMNHLEWKNQQWKIS